MDTAETSQALGQRGSGYHLICLRGIDPVQDALNSVQLGMQGFDALLRPLLGLERPQGLGGRGVETWSWSGSDRAGERARGREHFPDDKTTPGL